MIGVEHPRDGENGDVRVTLGPDPTAPHTWLRCVAPGCNARVHPLDHNTRCATHRPIADHRGDDDRARLVARARAIVAANRG